MSPDAPAPPLSMLRVKSENGEQAFLLMMRAEDTMGDVRALLAQARWAAGMTGSPQELGPHWLHLTSLTHSPGAQMPPPSRSSAHFRPPSTRTTHSRCGPLAWCPTPHCFCGDAGPCQPAPAASVPVLAPTLNKARSRGWRL